MRFVIILIILLMSAICSCRSQSHAVTQTADSTALEISEVKSDVSADEVLSLVRTSGELDVSGVTIEFFPPDSAHPDVRAAPKSITIENAKAKAQTNAAQHEVSITDGTDSVDANLSQSKTSAQDSRTDYNILRPSDWAFFFVIVLSLALLFIYFLWQSRK